MKSLSKIGISLLAVGVLAAGLSACGSAAAATPATNNSTSISHVEVSVGSGETVSVLQPSEADHSNNASDNQSPEGAIELLTREEAAELARNSTDGLLLQCGLDNHRDRIVYKMEFLGSDGYKTEIELDAISGEVLLVERDDEKEGKADVLNAVTMTHQEAAEKALASVTGSKLLATELDTEWGKASFEVDIADESGVKHTICVDASTGEILSSVRDKVKGEDTVAITPSQAEEKALTSTGGGIIVECLLDDENGSPCYEIVAVSNQGVAYEIDVDAVDGNLIQQQRGDDYDD